MKENKKGEKIRKEERKDSRKISKKRKMSPNEAKEV